MNINPCPACGSEMELEESGAAQEIYGWALQDITLGCKNLKCYTKFSLEGDFMYLKVSEEDVINVWNNLTGEKKNV